MKKAENIPLTISILPPKQAHKGIADYRKIHQEQQPVNETFEELLTGLVRKHFLEACRRMWPLMEDTHLTEITIKLSISGVTTSTLAQYSPSRSSQEEGKYYLVARPALLMDYLANHFFEVALDEKVRLTWDHEIVHMLDQGSITEPGYDLQRPDVTEVLVGYILSFREEGLAELIYFLRGYSKMRSIKAARTKFLNRMEFFRNRPWHKPGFAKRMFYGINQYPEYYSVGSWMLLHVMGSEGYPGKMEDAAIAATKIRKREEISEEDILSLLRQAMKVDNHHFIKGITQPGPDGKPFVEHEELADLARYMDLCKADLERNWSRPSQLVGDPKLIELFRLMRPKG